MKISINNHPHELPDGATVADAVATICEGLRQDIVDRGVPEENVTVIPNAVDPDEFAHPAPPDTALKSRLGLDGATEWPLVRAMLPPLAGKRVADLGCGFGWASRWMREQGAASVLGFQAAVSVEAGLLELIRGHPGATVAGA